MSGKQICVIAGEYFYLLMWYFDNLLVAVCESFFDVVAFRKAG